MNAHSKNYYRRDTSLILSFSATDPAVILRSDLVRFLDNIGSDPSEPLCIKTRPDLIQNEDDDICIEISSVTFWNAS